MLCEKDDGMMTTHYLTYAVAAVELSARLQSAPGYWDVQIAQERVLIARNRLDAAHWWNKPRLLRAHLEVSVELGRLMLSSGLTHARLGSAQVLIDHCAKAGPLVMTQWEYGKLVEAFDRHLKGL